MTATNGMPPVHPGEILREEMDERGLSADALAQALDIPAGRVTGILNGHRDVTQDTARRLSRFFRNHDRTLAQRCDQEKRHRAAQEWGQRPAGAALRPGQQLGLHGHGDPGLEHQVVDGDDDAPPERPAGVRTHGISALPSQPHTSALPRRTTGSPRHPPPLGLPTHSGSALQHMANHRTHRFLTRIRNEPTLGHTSGSRTTQAGLCHCQRLHHAIQGPRPSIHGAIPGLRTNRLPWPPCVLRPRRTRLFQAYKCLLSRSRM